MNATRPLAGLVRARGDASAPSPPHSSAPRLDRCPILWIYFCQPRAGPPMWMDCRNRSRSAPGIGSPSWALRSPSGRPGLARLRLN
eukprot:scaffold182389_cov18-Tisochrysis_lutea.AAC.1